MGTEIIRVDWSLVALEWVMLPDGTVRRPIDVYDWCSWARWGRDQCGYWQIAQTFLADGARVSTAFMGLDLRPFGGGPTFEWNPETGDVNVTYPPDYRPVVFETMIFGGPCANYEDRYRTVQEARQGHWRAVLIAEEAMRQLAEDGPMDSVEGPVL